MSISVKRALRLVIKGIYHVLVTKIKTSLWFGNDSVMKSLDKIDEISYEFRKLEKELKESK